MDRHREAEQAAQDFRVLNDRFLAAQAGLLAKDLQDGLVPIDENDCLANVPYVPGCGL